MYIIAQLFSKGGHVAFFGLTGADAVLPLPILQTVLAENSLKGPVAGMGQDMHDALTLLTHGRFRTDAFARAAYPPARLQDAFDTAADRPGVLMTQIVIH